MLEHGGGGGGSAQKRSCGAARARVGPQPKEGKAAHRSGAARAAAGGWRGLRPARRSAWGAHQGISRALSPAFAFLSIFMLRSQKRNLPSAATVMKKLHSPALPCTIFPFTVTSWSTGSHATSVMATVWLSAALLVCTGFTARLLLSWASSSRRLSFLRTCARGGRGVRGAGRG